jgi:hypothetical protein
MVTVPAGYPPATVPGVDLLHPEAVPQTYLDASKGELSNGASLKEHGYDATIAAGGSPVRSTGATAGTPGAFTPANSDPPDSPAKLIAAQPNAVTASPATAWTSGQYVQTGTSGTAGRAHWNGTAWVAGAKP